MGDRIADVIKEIHDRLLQERCLRDNSVVDDTRGREEGLVVVHKFVSFEVCEVSKWDFDEEREEDEAEGE